MLDRLSGLPSRVPVCLYSGTKFRQRVWLIRVVTPIGALHLQETLKEVGVLYGSTSELKCFGNRRHRQDGAALTWHE